MHATTRRKDLDVARVQQAIEAAERRTSAEIVVAVAPFFVGGMWAAARRAFRRLGIAGNGVLVFVVPARRDVVVLADEGAYQRLAPAVWHGTATRIANEFARGQGTEGLVAGIEHLATALAATFPRRAEDALRTSEA